MIQLREIGCLSMMVYYFISEWMIHSITVFVNLSLCYEVTNLSDFYLWIITCFGFKEMWCSRHCRLSVANLTCRLLLTLHFKFSRENPVILAFWSLKIKCVLNSVVHIPAYESSLTYSLCSTLGLLSQCSCYWASPLSVDWTKDISINS